MIRRLAPIALVAAAVAGLWLTRSSAAHPAFTAYRGPHHVGDLIGPNARVVAVDAHGNPTAVVSTDGKAPVVWSFELTASVPQLRGSRVRSLDPGLWAHPACPSSMCAAGSPGPPLQSAPPPLAINPCPSLSPAELSAHLGPGRLVATSPGPGTCVWNNGRVGAQLEVGGAAWWSYLTGLRGLYAPDGADTLVDAHHGLHLAVRHGSVTAILLTSVDPSPSHWHPLVEEAAAWAASH